MIVILPSDTLCNWAMGSLGWTGAVQINSQRKLMQRSLKENSRDCCFFFS